MTTPGASAPGEPGLTDAEKRVLVRLAREAIAARLAGGSFEPDAGAHPVLRERRGAFVTLHSARSGELRGCIGRLQPGESLADTVAEMAVAAATSDTRFPPVAPAELPDLRIEVSALGPMHPIRPEDVEVGRHGLLISRSGRRGVLLPQVPVEHGWDRETFLDQTCVKAGLPPGSWRDGDAELLAFTAEVFGEA